MPIVQPFESDSGLTIVRVRKPSLELATVAQPIGYEAWRNAMPGRPESQIHHVFNPDNPENAQRLLSRMRSKVGLFAGVVAIQDGLPVGYAWAADDVGNMSRVLQGVKTIAGRLKGEKPYAWTAQINVLPDYQRSGIGTVMLGEVLTPFDEAQKDSVYVFSENQVALSWFQRRGFAARPDHPVDPNEKPGDPDIYFGHGALHVSQWRLEALSNADVLAASFSHADLPEYTLAEAA